MNDSISKAFEVLSTLELDIKSGDNTNSPLSCVAFQRKAYAAR